MNPTPGEPLVRPFEPGDIDQVRRHFARHRAESGRGDGHFMPFAPGDPDGPRGADLEACARALTEPGWERWIVAVVDDQIVGHVNLKGDRLKVARHRCELGIGIERAYRGRGIGGRLMTAAIELASDAPTLEWIDLRVFAPNTAARALYRRFGFTEIGTLADRFRIDGEPIDDVIMTLLL